MKNGTSKRFEIRRSASVGMSSPHSKAMPLFTEISRTSSYVMRGKGISGILKLRPRALRSSDLFLITRSAIAWTSSSCRRMFSSCPAKACSASIIQNSVVLACFRLFRSKRRLVDENLSKGRNRSLFVKLCTLAQVRLSVKIVDLEECRSTFNCVLHYCGCRYQGETVGDKIVKSRVHDFRAYPHY